MKMTLIAPCHFGTEAVLKREINDLGYEIVKTEDGRVSFAGDEEAVALSNVFLRSAERILIEVGTFHATTFDELFEGTKALEWEKYIPQDARFWVTKASSVKSSLFSPRDIQSIVKKAIVERIKYKYNRSWFSEDGADYPIRVSIMKDEVTIGLDTTGISLHKRGYRKYQSLAPISETLAASLIQLTPWKKDRILVDPFCGCGTIPIEALMIAANIAPGINRDFTFGKWANLKGSHHLDEAREEARDLVDTSIDTDIQGYDIDPKMVELARANLKLLGYDDLKIHFQTRSVSELSHHKKYGFVITNPPYGERLEELESLKRIYSEFGESFKRLDSWSAYVITSFGDMERYFGRRADKKRKIYNGMIKTDYFQFLGPKPPKRNMA